MGLKHSYHELAARRLREGKTLKEISTEYRELNLQRLGNPLSLEGLDRHRRAATTGALLSRGMGFRRALALARGRGRRVRVSERTAIRPSRHASHATGLLERFRNPSSGLMTYAVLGGVVYGAWYLWKQHRQTENVALAPPNAYLSDPYQVNGPRWPTVNEPANSPTQTPPGLIWPY